MRLKLRYAFEAETELTHWPENMSEYNTLYAINMSLYPTYNDNIKPFLIPARNSFHLIAFYEKRHCLSLNPFFFFISKTKSYDFNFHPTHLRCHMLHTRGIA